MITSTLNYTIVSSTVKADVFEFVAYEKFDVPEAQEIFKKGTVELPSSTFYSSAVDNALTIANDVWDDVESVEITNVSTDYTLRLSCVTVKVNRRDDRSVTLSFDNPMVAYEVMLDNQGEIVETVKCNAHEIFINADRVTAMYSTKAKRTEYFTCIDGKVEKLSYGEAETFLRELPNLAGYKSVSEIRINDYNRVW